MVQTGNRKEIVRQFENEIQDLLDEVKRLESSGVKCFIFQPPLEKNIENLTEFEKDRLRKWKFDYGHITVDDCRIIKKVYTEDVDIDYLCRLYDGSKVFERNGIKYLANYRSKYVNVITGERLTYYQPIEFAFSIYIFGQCTVRGNGVEDKNTISSFLQKKINEKNKGCCRVCNCGIGCGSGVHDDIAHLKNKNFKEGDVVIFCTNFELASDGIFEKNGVEKYDCSFLFNRPHDYGEWFTDETFHLTPNGNKVIADYFYEILTREGVLKTGKEISVLRLKCPDRIDLPYDRSDMEEFLKMLRPYHHIGMKCGGIVMGCNPFTNGHLYLIETAAKKMDWLYIFVVEEERFFFDFETRISLVRRGTQHIKNVTVLSSGKVLLSAVTFPGYFMKENESEVSVDASSDIMIFGEYIAPELGIQVRFVGEEPIDYITRQYNVQMKEILPKYGIEVCEIKRKELSGKAISASTVRNLLKERKFDHIKKLVPQTTYAYLMENYGK